MRVREGARMTIKVGVSMVRGEGRMGNVYILFD